MDIHVVMTELLAVSVLTQLTTEAVKKICNNTDREYSSNVIAAIMAVILAAVVVVGYALYTGIAVDTKYVITGIALAYLSFLAATVGYDKIIQALQQIGII